MECNSENVKHTYNSLKILLSDIQFELIDLLMESGNLILRHKYFNGLKHA